MTDYDLKFTRLSKYAPEEVATDELKMNRFERGLKLEIREKLAVRPLTYSDVIEAATRAEEMIQKRTEIKSKKKKTEGTSS